MLYTLCISLGPQGLTKRAVFVGYAGEPGLLAAFPSFGFFSHLELSAPSAILLELPTPSALLLQFPHSSTRTPTLTEVGARGGTASLTKTS